MKHRLMIAITLMTIAFKSAHAGSLKNGVWTADGCGKQPAPPTVNDIDIEAYNQSIQEINDWQQKSRAYFECVVQEANNDNQKIVDSTNKQQASYRETLNKVTAEAEAASKNFVQP
jgi:hypothetical protein